MKVIEREQANLPLGELAEQIGNEPVIVTEQGTPILALLPIVNADLETVSLSLNPTFLQIMERSKARLRAEGGISSDEMRRRLTAEKSTAATESPKFWIVGAARSRQEDHYQEFITGSYWKLFYRDEEQPDQAAKRDLMRPGDRIAIKKMVGGKNGNGKVRIRAIGTIQRCDKRRKRVSVSWDLLNLDREVRGHSLLKSIHGPFSAQTAIVKDVFRDNPTQ